jgi:phosphatidylserine decarboxylase
MILLIIPLLLVLFILFFYRYPSPIIRQNNYDSVYSPAYGTIVNIEYIPENKLLISTFLSPLDVHYQFYPISGIVTNIKYDKTGKYNLAYELTKSRYNEKYITTISNKNGDFVIYQIAGYFVRRIISYSKLNETVESGEPLGLIHFGSRVDLIVPNASRFRLLAKKGDYVRGSNTLLGSYI